MSFADLEAVVNAGAWLLTAVATAVVVVHLVRGLRP